MPNVNAGVCHRLQLLPSAGKRLGDQRLRGEGLTPCRSLPVLSGLEELLLHGEEIAKNRKNVKISLDSMQGEAYNVAVRSRAMV